jgi:hypothetical protein
MKKYFTLTIIWFLTFGGLYSQGGTAVSMYLKKDRETRLEYIESKRGNLFSKLGHHGPAIENQWYALRLYFNRKTAIDVYSKATPGLELGEKKWYPSGKEQLEGWGADYYKVGNTVGLGGIKLWDGDEVLDLNPVLKRSARVSACGDSCSMEMISEGIPYRGSKVDIKIRVSMYASKREARIEAFSMNGEAVQFVTGINYFPDFVTRKGEHFALSWGIHPEDVAAEKVEVGAALILNPDIIEKQLDDGHQLLFISRPVQTITSWVTSYSAREPGIASYEDFELQLKAFLQK